MQIVCQPGPSGELQGTASSFPLFSIICTVCSYVMQFAWKPVVKGQEPGNAGTTK